MYPLGFLSKHPLLETGKHAVEKVVKFVAIADPAVLVDSIKKETLRDWPFQKLSKRMLRGDLSTEKRLT